MFFPLSRTSCSYQFQLSHAPLRLFRVLPFTVSRCSIRGVGVEEGKSTEVATQRAQTMPHWYSGMANLKTASRLPANKARALQPPLHPNSHSDFTPTRISNSFFLAMSPSS